MIAARGYRTILNANELRELGFARDQCRSPGLLLPVHTPDGQQPLCVYRPDLPRVLDDRRKGRLPDGTYPQRVIKYEFPKGQGMRIDCPPLCRSKLGDPQTPLWITEGQKKADALASHGPVRDRAARRVELQGEERGRGHHGAGGLRRHPLARAGRADRLRLGHADQAAGAPGVGAAAHDPAEPGRAGGGGVPAALRPQRRQAGGRRLPGGRPHGRRAAQPGGRAAHRGSAGAAHDHAAGQGAADHSPAAGPDRRPGLRRDLGVGQRGEDGRPRPQRLGGALPAAAHRDGEVALHRAR